MSPRKKWVLALSRTTQPCILLREGLDKGARGAIETQNEAIINTDERYVNYTRIFVFSSL